jgi:hypothetical protein
MIQHNFRIVGGDTDSIMFCKQDMSPFSEKEQNELLKEINTLLPKEIKFANDGIFSKVIYLKAKNYVMVDQKGKRKVKGSSLKSATLEPIMKEMINEIVELLLNDKQDQVVNVYTKYRQMVENITDITPWCSKKTLSPTTYNSTRKNETDIINALEGSEYGSGDKVYLYTLSKIIETGDFYLVGAKKGQVKTKKVKYLKLKENFNGDHCKEHYRNRIEDCISRFEPVLGTKFWLTNNK